MVGMTFFIFKITEVIASPQLMADTQEHPVVADFEQVAAGDIFALPSFVRDAVPLNIP
jgi:hypothetical protein